MATMKFLVFFVLLYAVLISASFPQGLADDNSDDQARYWPWDASDEQHHAQQDDDALPPVPHPPFHPWSDPTVHECLKAFYAEEKCVRQTMQSLASGKIEVDGDCCQTVLAVKKDCLPIVFYGYNRLFFPKLLIKHCAEQSWPPAPL